MLTTVLILASCGVAGGYLFGRSALFEYQRDRWERKRDVLDAALYGLIGELEIPLYTVEGDDKILSGLGPNEIPVDMPTGKAFWWMRARWAFYFLLTCNICFGWHAIWVVMAASGLTSAFTDYTTYLVWGDAFPTWLAACGVHTIITGIGNRMEIW